MCQAERDKRRVMRNRRVFNTAAECGASSSKAFTLLRILQILAVPAVISGCIMLYDVFVAVPQHETVTIVGKNIGYGRSSEHSLEVKGTHKYRKAVSWRFYDSCPMQSTAELTYTPLFREWKRIALTRAHGCGARVRFRLRDSWASGNADKRCGTIRIGLRFPPEPTTSRDS